MQDVKVTRATKSGRGKGKRKRKKEKVGSRNLQLSPLFLSPDGEITTEDERGQPLSYHVARDQFLGDADDFLDDEKLVVAEN